MQIYVYYPEYQILNDHLYFDGLTNIKPCMFFVLHIPQLIGNHFCRSDFEIRNILVVMSEQPKLYSRRLNEVME